jgi:hypothetical protein
MRSSHLAFFCAAALLPGFALAKAWQGVSPGMSTQVDVLNRFGEPSTRGKLEGRSAVVYKGDQAISGTKQAQFLAAEDGTITEINVFPASQLDKEAVEGTYGKSARKTFTDDFRPVWIYRSLGVMVFFGKDGFVEAIRFKAPEIAPTSAEVQKSLGKAGEKAAATMQRRAPDRAGPPPGSAGTAGQPTGGPDERGGSGAR